MLVPLVLVVLASGYALHVTMDGFTTSAATYQEDALPLARLHAALLGAETPAWAASVTPDGLRTFAFRDAAGQIHRRFSELEASGRLSGEERRDLAKAHAAWSAADANLLYIVKINLSPSATSGLMNGFSIQLRRADDFVQQADRDAQRRARRAWDRAHLLHTISLAFMLVVTALGGAVAALAARWLARSIIDPIERLGAAADRLGRGDLAHRVDLGADDELGALGRAFNSMAARLEEGRDELAHRAFHDSLTGLANRALLLDRATHALLVAERRETCVALIVADLDEFKTVNDSLGHAAGDEVLREVAVRLRSVVRDTDTIARLGGDEFAIVLEDVQTEAEAVDVAERINEVLRRSASIGGRDVSVRASLGIAIARTGDDAGDILRNADLAMYRAKQGGRDRASVFEAEMHDAMLERLVLEGELRDAIEGGQLVVHYQPTFELDTACMVGMEALVRWRHPTRGLLLPGSFIALAEETGLIVPLGWWVLDEACAQVARWRRDQPITLSVNLSARQLQQPDLEARVRGALARSGLDPADLVLEITESQMMADATRAREQMEMLKRIGVRLAVDDFGTGYSSLGYLRDFPIDVLKIDKSFVDNVTADDGRPAMMEAIIGLARALGLTTVAEGIEVDSQWDAMRGMGCELGQGFLFARPMSAAALELHFTSDEFSIAAR